MGALAVALTDPNVVYAGTGSACIRRNVSSGIGMYRSTDAGETWNHIGLDDAGQISRVRVHPRDPDLVYAAVLGTDRPCPPPWMESLCYVTYVAF